MSGWDSALQRLSRGLSADEAQRWLVQLGPAEGGELRELWRRALLRLALLHRCVPEGDVGWTTLRGVALVLDALEGGLELRDVYELESALYGALQSEEMALWLEAAALALRGRERWGGSLTDCLLSSVVSQLLERGERQAAVELFPEVRWRQYTVRALVALWPHGDAHERARWLAHTDAVLAACRLPPGYLAEPLAELVALTGSRERLEALERLVLSLAPSEPGPDHEPPHVSWLLARQHLGEDVWAPLRALPSDELRWLAAFRLAEAAVEPARTALVDDAWQTLSRWPEAQLGHARVTLELDPVAGAARAVAFTAPSPQDGAHLLDLLPEALRPELAAQIARLSALEPDTLESLAEAGFGHLLPEGAPLPEPAVQTTRAPSRTPRGDSLAQEQILQTLGWTLPREIVLPREGALREALGDREVTRMLAEREVEREELDEPELGEAFRERLERPGCVSRASCAWLARAALQREGPGAGALLDDVLQWWRAT